MKNTLPGWIVDDAASVCSEAEPYSKMTEEQRLSLLAMACRAAAKIVLSREDAVAVLAYEDPLPESSRRALERLRASAGKGVQQPSYRNE